MVPDQAFSNFMADRVQLKTDIEDLLRILCRRDTSSIHLLWAWFGAGKTHSLFYISDQASLANGNCTNNGLYPVYSEFPRAVKGFVDLYRSLAEGFSVDLLADSFLEISTCSESKSFQQQMLHSSPDLANALTQIAMGDAHQQLTAFRWLRAENLPLAQLRGVGISKRIDSAEEALRIAVALMTLIRFADRARGRPGTMILWMIDEFQRIAKCSPRVCQEVNVGLHSLFNATPNGLAIFISFSGTPQKKLPDWFGRELKDRLARAKMMLLPPLTFEESLLFLRNVLSRFRLPGSNADAYFPFTQESAKLVLTEVNKHGQLKPRAIMQAFGAVLEEADQRIEAGTMKSIDSAFAQRALAERLTFSDGEEDEPSAALE